MPSRTTIASKRGRFTLRTNIHQVAEFLQAPLPGFDIRPRYNVSPRQMIVAVRGAKQREIVQFKWGVIAAWATDPKIALQCLNARSATVATKPAFHSA